MREAIPGHALGPRGQGHALNQELCLPISQPLPLVENNRLHTICWAYVICKEQVTKALPSSAISDSLSNDSIRILIPGKGGIRERHSTACGRKDKAAFLTSMDCSRPVSEVHLPCPTQTAIPIFSYQCWSHATRLRYSGPHYPGTALVAL